MKKKQEIVIIRVTKVEKAMIQELKETNSINISALIRNFIKNYYEENSVDKIKK